MSLYADQSASTDPCFACMRIVIREASAEESDQFRFLRAASLANLKGCIGLILAN